MVSMADSAALARVAQELRLFGPPFSADQRTLSFNADGKLVISEGRAVNHPKGKRSAVLVCLFQGDDGELRVILTKRSSKLSSHAGDVALPGGKADEGDADDAATALREAMEEIGLDPLLVHVLTVLDPITMKHGMMVVPVVGLLLDKSSFKPTLNADEVEAVFDAPLEMFLKDENRREEEKEWMGHKYLLHYFDYKGYVIYALTAGILIRAASVVYQKSPLFTLGIPTFWTSNAPSISIN